MRRAFIQLFERMVYGQADQPCRERIEKVLRGIGTSILTLHALIAWQQISQFHISYFFYIFVDSPLKYALRTIGAVLFVFDGNWWEIVLKLFLLVSGYLPSLVILAGPLLVVLARLVENRGWRQWLDLVLAANWLFFGMNVLAIRWE
jgi:hypothetical protein